VHRRGYFQFFPLKELIYQFHHVLACLVADALCNVCRVIIVMRLWNWVTFINDLSARAIEPSACKWIMYVHKAASLERERVLFLGAAAAAATITFMNFHDNQYRLRGLRSIYIIHTQSHVQLAYLQTWHNRALARKSRLIYHQKETDCNHKKRVCRFISQLIRERRAREMKKKSRTVMTGPLICLAGA
jgi:hypothetical protein